MCKKAMHDIIHIFLLILTLHRVKTRDKLKQIRNKKQSSNWPLMSFHAFSCSFFVQRSSTRSFYWRIWLILKKMISGLRPNKNSSNLGCAILAWLGLLNGKAKQKVLWTQLRWINLSTLRNLWRQESTSYGCIWWSRFYKFCFLLLKQLKQFFLHWWGIEKPQIDYLLTFTNQIDSLTIKVIQVMKTSSSS